MKKRRLLSLNVMALPKHQMGIFDFMRYKTVASVSYYFGRLINLYRFGGSV